VRPLILFAVACLTVLQVVLLRKATGRPLPFAAIVIVVLNLVGATGYLYFDDLAAAGGVSSNLTRGPLEYAAAAKVFALASAAVFAGGLLAALRRMRPYSASVRPAAVHDVVAAVSRMPRSALLIGSSIPVLLSFVGGGPAALLSRASYLTATGPAWMVELGGSLTPVGLAGISFILFDKARPVGRIWASFLLVAYGLVLFSRGTRELAVVPLLLLASYLLQATDRRGRRRIVVTTLFAGLASLLLLQLTLTLRGEAGAAGLAPYVSALMRNPTAAFSFAGGVGPVVANVLFSVPLTGYLAANVTALPSSDLLTSLTPMPSQFTDWAQLEPILRFDIYTPYSTLGELAIQGTAVLCLYFLLVGAVVTWLQMSSANLGGLRSLVLQLGLGPLLVLFSLTVLQYNLRPSTRFLWYALAFYVVVRLVGRTASRHGTPLQGAASRRFQATLPRETRPHYPLLNHK
jgi:hypothetical protein